MPSGVPAQSRDPILAERESKLKTVTAKLDDTIELLHMWKDEALAYRSLIEEIAKGNISPCRAGELLEEYLRGE